MALRCHRGAGEEITSPSQPDRPFDGHARLPWGFVLWGLMLCSAGLSVAGFLWRSTREVAAETWPDDPVSIAVRVGTVTSFGTQLLIALAGVLAACRWRRAPWVAIVGGTASVLSRALSDGAVSNWGDVLPVLAINAAFVLVPAAWFVWRLRRVPRERPVTIGRRVGLIVETLLGAVLVAQGVSILSTSVIRSAFDAKPARVQAVRSERETFRRELPLVDGGTRSIWEPGPKVTIVDFWATWCGPCWRAMPHLAEIEEAHAARGVSLVLVTSEDVKAARVRELLEDRDLDHLTCVLDDQAAVFRELGLSVFPTTVLLDATGQPRLSFTGVTEPEVLMEHVERMLAQPPAER